MINFPKIGDKLAYKGVPEFYYPMFLSMKGHAEKHLTVGEIYTVRKVEVLSSWCCVWLEEVEDDEIYFNRLFFQN